MCAPRGRKKQLPGLSSWKKKSSWFWEGRGGREGGREGGEGGRGGGGGGGGGGCRV